MKLSTVTDLLNPRKGRMPMPYILHCHQPQVMCVSRWSEGRNPQKAPPPPPIGASVDHAQDTSQDNLSLPSAGEPRDAPFDASPAGEPRSSPDFERCGGDA